MLRRRNKVLKYKINKLKRRSIFLLKKYKKIVVFVFLLIIFFIVVKISYKKYINNPDNIITKVYFNKKLIENPNFSSLCEYVSDTFSGANSVKNKFFGYKKQISLIEKKYKYVKNLKIDLINNKSIKVSIKFKSPKLAIFGSGYAFFVYDEKNIYSFDNKYLSGLNLSSTGVILYLPKYLSKLKNVNNIFWKNSPDKIIKYYKLIKKFYPKAKIFYLAGGEDLLVFVNGKKIIFSLSKNINEQINQLRLLILKMPDKYNLAKNIDIGNLDNGIYLDVYKK